MHTLVLERQIARLQRRIDGLRRLSQRCSSCRLGIFAAGLLSAWAAARFWGTRAGWLVFAAAAVSFFGVVVYHRWLDRWLEKFRIWQEIHADSQARLGLDWDRIPRPPLSPTDLPDPLETDLDLAGWRSLHQLLDTAVSLDGSRLLAAWLSHPAPDLPLVEERQAIVRELARLTGFRQRLRLNFRLASKDYLDGQNLLRWLDEPFSPRPLRGLLSVSAVLAVVNIALFVLNSLRLLPAYWIAGLVVYAAVYLFGHQTFSPFLEAVIRFSRELQKFQAILRYLETYPYPSGGSLAKLCQPFTDPANLPSARLRRVDWIAAAAGLRSNPILGMLANLILPWDMSFAYLAGWARTQVARSLAAWLDAWYRLEASASLGNFAALHPAYAFPQVAAAAEPVLEARAMGHPLIPVGQKVSNDFSVRGLGEVAVITGSNMAGKSTFIKTLGVNLCLAYAGGPVDAAYFRCIPFRIYTCIRINDSIADGFSYFYAEVRRLKGLLAALRSDDPLPLLYLIDEIFRGTNNRERLIGSRSYLRAVTGGRGVGLLATHDLELASLAGQSPLVSNFHFRDDVRDGKLVFDYKIHPGPSPTTNALAIMRLEGLPVED